MTSLDYTCSTKVLLMFILSPLKMALLILPMRHFGSAFNPFVCCSFVPPFAIDFLADF